MSALKTIHEFDRVKHKILAQSTPSSGGDLQGMLLDFEHSLSQSRLLTCVRVRKTGDPGCMIEATGEPAAGTLTVSEIAAEMERLWLEELRYSPFEAHFLHRVDYRGVLDFVTTSGPGGFSVTGRMAVDISKIQGPTKTVTFQYRLVGSGWSEAEIFDVVNHASLFASYRSDAPRALAEAVIGLLQGSPRSTCSFETEPGAYRWLLFRESNRLRIEIRRFEDTFSRQPDEKGRLIFSTACHLRQFGDQVMGELQRLLADRGIEEYRRSWGYDFPLGELRRLEALLAGRDTASG